MVDYKPSVLAFLDNFWFIYQKITLASDTKGERGEEREGGERGERGGSEGGEGERGERGGEGERGKEGERERRGKREREGERRGEESRNLFCLSLFVLFCFFDQLFTFYSFPSALILLPLFYLRLGGMKWNESNLHCVISIRERGERGGEEVPQCQYCICGMLLQWCRRRVGRWRQCRALA